MSDRDDLIIIQAVTNAIKVDIEDCIKSERGVCDLHEVCSRLDSAIDDMRSLLEVMEN